mgnify:CR=1 FL=1
MIAFSAHASSSLQPAPVHPHEPVTAPGPDTILAQSTQVNVLPLSFGLFEARADVPATH